MNMKDSKPGDLVQITTDKEILKGILMPRPELLKENITVLKLDNGYNIGIEQDKIKQIKTIKGYTPIKPKKIQHKQDKSLPNVAILSTGGTISSKIDYKTGGVYADYTAEDFVEMCPELKDIANLKSKKIMGLMSEDINPDNWQEMANLISKEIKDVDGIVVTHGTDTMHFSSAALSFLLKTGKPIILTGAQRSIDRGSSDAFMNLICSVNAAANFKGAGVYICMHGSSSDDHCLLIRGTKVRKMHTSRRDAFRPINEKPIAKVFPDANIEILNDNFPKKSDQLELDNKFEKKTALITVYPGMDPSILDHYIDKGYKGIVLAATALGHVPTIEKEYSLLEGIQKATKKGIPVIIATQTIYGRTHPFVYTNLRKLSVQNNCIFAEDMLPEVAYVKLGWVLAHTTDLKKVKEMMLTNYHGEITERSDSNAFLI
jgi:glutamyl-tRNA(Gln) amidotransferase subunit D